MKQFVYLFILDIGVSPFVRCYEGKTLIQGCIAAYRDDFLKELLLHKYEFITHKEFEIFKYSAVHNKDNTGNNLMHSIFEHKN